MYPVREIEQGGALQRTKKQSGGLFFSAWLVESRNVYRDDCGSVGGTGFEQGGSDDASLQRKQSAQWAVA